MTDTSKKPYPSEEEIRNKLRPIKWGLFVFVIICLLIGGWSELCFGIDTAFQRSAGFSTVVAVFVYFWLDHFDYRTGVPGHYFDAAGHVVPKKIMALNQFSITLLCTLMGIFGDLIIAKAKLSEIVLCLC